jgi:hypothetical protein
MAAHKPHREPRGGVGKTRVLIAFEDEYRSYRDAIASAISVHRPRADVAAAGLGALEDEMVASTPTWWCAAGPTQSTPMAGRPGSSCPRIPIGWPRSVSTGSARRWPTPPSRSCFRWSMRPRGLSARSPTRGIADSRDTENCLRVGSAGVGFREYHRKQPSIRAIDEAAGVHVVATEVSKNVHKG